MWRRGSRRGGGEEEECSGLRDGRWKGRGRGLEWNGRECDGQRRKDGGIKREKATSRENVLSCGRRAARSPAATSGHKGICGDGRSRVNSQSPLGHFLRQDSFPFIFVSFLFFSQATDFN